MGPDKGSNWGSNNTAGQWLRQSEKKENKEVFFISWQVFAMIETREAIENLDSILDLEVTTNIAQKIIVFVNKGSLRDWMVHSWVPAISQSLSEFPPTSAFPSANTLLPDGMSFSHSPVFVLSFAQQ